VVSDGSTDGTAASARQVARAVGVGQTFVSAAFSGRQECLPHARANVRVLELPSNVGKAAALSAGCTAAVHDILVFADARQTWAADALPLLLENFADPSVGAVSGDLVVQSAPGVMAGVGLYWQYEKELRKLESQVHSTVGVTGAISAVRRRLFRAIPPGTLLDDVYWPLQVAMQGLRVVHDGRAHAYDRLPARRATSSAARCARSAATSSS